MEQLVIFDRKSGECHIYTIDKEQLSRKYNSDLEKSIIETFIINMGHPSNSEYMLTNKIIFH